MSWDKEKVGVRPGRGVKKDIVGFCWMSVVCRARQHPVFIPIDNNYSAAPSRSRFARFSNVICGHHCMGFHRSILKAVVTRWIDAKS